MSYEAPHANEELQELMKFPSTVVAKYIAAITPNSEILDLGSGNGRNTLLAARYGTVTAIDKKPEEITALSQRAESQIAGGRIQLVCEDFADPDLELGTDKYGGVIAIYSLRFSLNWQNIVARIMGATKPTGIVMIQDIARSPLTESTTPSDGLDADNLFGIFNNEHWGIMEHAVIEMETLSDDPKGLAIMRPVVTLVAQKP
jgi:SAM-dependent methyltransferase